MQLLQQQPLKVILIFGFFGVIKNQLRVTLTKVYRLCWKRQAAVACFNSCGFKSSVPFTCSSGGHIKDRGVETLERMMPHMSPLRAAAA